MTCISHDKPIVADIVLRSDCKVLSPACETCITHLQDRQSLKEPTSLKQAVQYRLIQ